MTSSGVLGLGRREPDVLRPSATAALAAWAARVQADHEQVDRCREVADPSDFYAPVADRFRMDPRRSDDATLAALRALARPDETWLDIGAGAGRYALPLALTVREVIAIDPSTAMLEALRDGSREHGITNVRTVGGRWPDAAGPEARADVALMAHVGYDIEAIGPFLEAMERAAGRLCVAVMGEAAMTTAASLFWGPVHGEARVALPALPELLVVLLALDRLPQVALVERTPPTFASFDEVLAMARRQLWLRDGSARDRQLGGLVRSVASERDGRWALDWRPTRIGVVRWSPDPALA
jgi:SAM-dependent methyltransferase